MSVRDRGAVGPIIGERLREPRAIEARMQIRHHVRIVGHGERSDGSIVCPHTTQHPTAPIPTNGFGRSALQGVN